MAFVIFRVAFTEAMRLRMSFSEAMGAFAEVSGREIPAAIQLN
jgi:hypothetical protein